MDSPPSLHLPRKFKMWRPGQVQAIESILSMPGPCLIQSVPTGGGKTLIYLTSAWVGDGRTVILTWTKKLQDQIIKDFGGIGVVEMKGKKAYPCRRGDGPTCEQGLCNVGVSCNLKEDGCTYYDQVKKAMRARIVVTNYAYWIVAGDRLGQFDRVIMDEAHDAPFHLAGSLTIELDLGHASKVFGYEIQGPKVGWAEWVRTWRPLIASLFDDLVGYALQNPQGSIMRKLWEAQRIKDSVDKVAEMLRFDMVDESFGKEVWRFDPIDVRRFVKPLMVRGADRTILTSATITKKVGDMMGLDYQFQSFPSYFPVENRPVYYVPTIGVSHRSSEGELKRWMVNIDNIIRARLDRKGIIHSVSYKRAEYIIAKSRMKQDMVEQVETYLRMTPPAVLVSPTVSTGYDFPGTDCEYQIICKIPFPDSRSKINKVRSDRDPELPMYQALQTVVQACGRGVRSATDRCETIIIDNNWEWVVKKFKHLVPKWFLEAVKNQRVLPPPAKKLS